ncbi:MAG: arginase [Candidatus Aminicenantes bacterium]|jgi:agmatinase|nr:arginase [Candidatus Aminicenantes bacterium]
MTDFGGAIKRNAEYDLAIIGVPFDEKSSYLRGPAGGPAAVRASSSGRARNPETELGVDLERDTVMVDLGDVNTSGDVDKTFQGVEDAVAAVFEKRARPIILGGDHSITYPILKAVAKYHRAVDILHFDAHPDLYEDLYGDRLSHACPFARILEDGLAKSLVQVGVRAATANQRALARRRGVRMVEMKDFREGLILSFKNPLYISFDMDALDPAFAPGVSHQEAGGLTTRQAIDLIHNLKARIIGLDVVELNPARDPSGITASAAFKIIKEVAGMMVKKRR